MKLTSKQNAFVKSLGTVKDGVLTIALVALDGVTSDRARSDYDDRYEKFSALVGKFSADPETGEIVIPLKDLCVGAEAPFTLSQANAPATWAGSALGSRMAFELGQYKSIYESELDPDSGNVKTVVRLRARTEAEIAQIKQQITDADAREEARKQAAKDKRKAAKAAEGTPAPTGSESTETPADPVVGTAPADDDQNGIVAEG